MTVKQGISIDGESVILVFPVKLSWSDFEEFEYFVTLSDCPLAAWESGRVVKEGKELRTALLTTASVVALSDFFFIFFLTYIQFPCL